MRAWLAALIGAAIGFAAGRLALPAGAFAHAGVQASAATVSTRPAAAAPLADAFDADAGTPWPDDAPTPEQVMYEQPALMQAALDRLAPQRPDKVDLYLLAFAGDGAENVFRNEAEYAARLFGQRLGARGRTLVLENNPATVASAPLATWSNLETALAGLHRIMDPRQDILVLYLTSHGGSDHSLLVDLKPLPLDSFDAGDFAGILAEQPFRWKVVVVNACFSGGFIPPLKAPGTLLLTAARADRTSFGCGAESKITYFGDAFLAHALNRTADFTEAFRRARTTIAGWERRDGITPSEPQLWSGAEIGAQLRKWRRGLQPGAPVPFRPAAPGPATDPPRRPGGAE